MHYIVFDMEFNQDFPSSSSDRRGLTQYPFEIIQIGAVKLDLYFNTIATFNRFVKPTIYSQINSYITDLTGITLDQLLVEEAFPKVFKDYSDFIGEGEAIFCVWGMSDMKELFRNADYHKLDRKRLPDLYINLQPYVSTHFELPQTKLLSLQKAVEAFEILMPYQFHNALSDAYYTAEIFKKINSATIRPKKYDPNYVIIRPRQQKRIIDFEKLILQFEKMYDREFTEEEQDIIKLAYKMGRTNQFIK